MDRLDTHENFPAGFREYLENYGWHFSKKMCEFAVGKMKKKDASGKETPITPIQTTRFTNFSNNMA